MVASDASQDRPQQGMAGILVSSYDFHRVGSVIQIDRTVFSLWDDTPVKIQDSPAGASGGRSRAVDFCPLVSGVPVWFGG